MRMHPSSLRLRRRLCPWERVLLAASREAHADDARHPIGSDHLLLGVLTEPDTRTSRYLCARGADRGSLVALLDPPPAGDADPGQGAAADRLPAEATRLRGVGRRVELTGEARRALAVALAAAGRERLTDLEPDQIAVGLAGTRDCRARQLLETFGLRPADLVAAATGPGR